MENLFLHFIIAGVKTFHHLIGDVESRINIKRGILEENCVIAFLLVVFLDEGLDGVVDRLQGIQCGSLEVYM